MNKYLKHQNQEIKKLQKVALITGSAVRIGKALALALASHGFYVFIHAYTSEKEADNTLNLIKKNGGSGEVIIKDLRKEDSYTAIIDHIFSVKNRLNVLINNASIFIRDTIHDATYHNFNQHMHLHVYAPFFLSQAFFLHMEDNKNQDNCCIINMLDGHISRPKKTFLTYLTSKMALFDLTKNLALSMAPIIRVNAIALGPTLPKKQAENVESEESFSKYALKTPLQVAITPEFAINSAMFLIDTPCLTGQTLFIDSGEHLTIRAPSQAR